MVENELSATSVYELYSVLGQGDTPRLFDQRYKLDTDHDIATAGGVSLDRKTVYIDRTLYQEVMDGEFKASGLDPTHIIRAWCEHEHTEVSISQGDNSSDTYFPCHRRALCREHELIRFLLGPGEAKIARYEETIWPGIMRAYHREPKTVPADLWCAPLLDQETERDAEVLAIYRRLGIPDATKRAKFDVRYGMSEHECGKCSMWSPDKLSMERGQLAACTAVSGVVRVDRGCELWLPKRQ